MQRKNERVYFRLIMTPCCGTLLCWVNPRMPNYCPECGKAIWLRKEGSHILHSDDNAMLRVTDMFDKEVEAVVEKNRNDK